MPVITQNKKVCPKMTQNMLITRIPLMHVMELGAIFVFMIMSVFLIAEKDNMILLRVSVKKRKMKKIRIPLLVSIHHGFLISYYLGWQPC